MNGDPGVLKKDQHWSECDQEAQCPVDLVTFASVLVFGIIDGGLESAWVELDLVDQSQSDYVQNRCDVYFAENYDQAEEHCDWDTMCEGEN